MKMRTPLTDRVNTEPAIINGMSASEANYIAAVSLVLSLLLGGVLFAVTGFWPMLIIFCMCGPLCALWYGSLYLQKVKRDRPDGFYVQSAHIWLSDSGIVKCRFNRHDRFYEIGASVKITFNPSIESTADSQSTSQR